jgi:hypothetical protein
VHAASDAPRVVRRIVCGYGLASLPGEWLQTWRRLDRLLKRTGFKVRASLSPLEELPDDTDILVVPPELREAGRASAAPGTPLLVTTPRAAADAFADLIQRLEAGTELAAERIAPDEPQGPRIVTYRGSTRLD